MERNFWDVAVDTFSQLILKAQFLEPGIENTEACFKYCHGHLLLVERTPPSEIIAGICKTKQS